VQRGQAARPRLGRPPTQTQGLAQEELLPQPGEGHRAHQRRPHLGELSLVIVGESAEEILPRHQFQDRIAQVLEALVVPTLVAPLVDPGGVGHGLAEQLPPLEAQPQALLQVVEAALRLHRLPGQFLSARSGPTPAGRGGRWGRQLARSECSFT